MGYLSYSERAALEQMEQFKQLPESVRSSLERLNPRRKVTQQQTLSSNHLPDIIEQAKEFAKSWKESVDSVCVEHHTEYEYGSEYTSVVLSLEALESEAQYCKRLLEVHKWNVSREEHDRKEFERLKAMFSSTDSVTK